MNSLTQKETSLETAKLLTNRVALVTRASRGIDTATAKLLASHGIAVGVNYFGNEVADQSVVKDSHQVEVMVQQVVEALGAIDTLVLNAAGSFKVARRDALTQMTPLRRIALPEDIADAILLLASEQARFITGAYLPVNGGIFMP